MYSLTKAQWANLLPVMRKHLSAHRHSDRPDTYTFHGTPAEYADAMRRCAYL